MEDRTWQQHAAGPEPFAPSPLGTSFAILDSSPNPVLATDAAGRITYLNAKVEAAFGYSRDELLGQPIEVLVPMDAAARHAKRRAGFHAHPAARPAGIGLDL